MLTKFFRDQRGSVIQMFAIAAVPMIVATGAVVDYNRAYDQSTVVQDAMDGAALAAGKRLGIWTDDQIKAEAQAFYNTNVGTKVDIKPTIDPVITPAALTLTTTLHVPTYFLGMIGLNEFVFNLKSQTTQAMGTLEVVMALDNSGSMSGTKIATLITAAKDLTDTLYGLAGTSTKPDPVKVGLAPFAASVKVDPTTAKAASPAWLDTTGVAPYNAESFEGSTGSPPVSNNTPSGKNVLDMFDTLTGTGAAWAGCLEERQAPYDVQDDVADTGTPATMFVPMFAPDEPDNWTCTTGSTCSKTCNSDADGSSCSSNSAGLRYNGAPTGNHNHNNYLPDANTATCGATVTISIANPGVVTKTAHGLTAGSPITLDSTGSLPGGLAEGTTYYVAAAGLATDSFRVTTANTGTNFTVPVVSSPTFTVTRANPAVFTKSSHGLVAGDSIRLSTTGDMYNPLTGGTSYYVIAAGLATNTFRVSTTFGGSALSTSGGGSQSGTHTFLKNAIFTSNGHGLAVGNAVQVSTTGTLPTGLTNNGTYYVTTATTNTFTLSATVGGVRIYVTGSQSGTHSFKKLVTTSGSQSGTHTIPPTNNDWTCANGNAGCGTGSVGKSEQTALLGQNVASNYLCKYGTVANKAAIASYNVQTNGGTYPSGPNFNCTTDAVVPLTTTKATVKTAIDNMAANGTTNITAGLMWGWRLLSPTAPYTEGRAYSVGDNKKILILMTDGENTYFANGEFTVSHYGAWGYIWKSHLGTTSSDQDVMQEKMEGRMEAACANVRAAGIEIFTVAFEINDATTKQLLKDCATDPDTMAFDASDPAELTAAFTAIGDQISLLRLAL